MEPVTLGILAGLYAGGKAIQGIGKAAGAGARLKGIKQVEASKGYKAQQERGAEASERLAKGQYGESTAGKRAQLGEILRAHEGTSSKAVSDTKSAVAASGGPGRSGRTTAALRDIVTGGRQALIAKGATGIEQADIQKSAQQMAADRVAADAAQAQASQLAQAKAGAKAGIWEGAFLGAGSAAEGYAGTQIQAGNYEGYMSDEQRLVDAYMSRHG